MKSISLTTMVSTDFGREVEITAFLRMYEEKWLKRMYMHLIVKIL